MKVINVDAETIDLMEAAAEMSMAAMRARARRVDPDGIISRSHKMSEFKIGEALRQLRRPFPLDWSDYSPGQKRLTMKLIEAFVSADDDHQANLLMRKIRASLFRYRSEPEAGSFGGEVSGDGLQNGSVADPSTTVEG